jgi:uncharacterized phage protein (TIGR01671 family)
MQQRQIKLRAKSMEGEWVYGFYNELPAKDMYWMLTDDRKTVSIDSNTRGEFTGLFDKNGKEIYEGDVVRLSCGYVRANPDHSVTAVVEYDEDRFLARLLDRKMEVKGGSSDGKTLPQYEIHSWVGMHTCLRESASHREVIGNIHENPELLESNDKPQHGPGSRCPIEFCPQCEKLDNA